MAGSSNAVAASAPGMKSGAAFHQMILASAGGLALVESRIVSVFRSDAKLLSEISQYLLSLGGKRIRPIVALTTGRLFGMKSPTQQLIDAASGIELIHMATLLHDDIIDESPRRRHKKSAYAEYGLAPSLLAGDFLLARAFGLCAHLDTFVIEATERACVELTEGEILEGTISTESRKTLAQYLQIVEKKTASLFALAGAVGAHTAGASSEDTERLRRFGYAAGIAFQIVDDILDVTADEDLLGKPSGTDLKQRTPSLINILWLESNSDAARSFFDREHSTPEEIKEAVAEIKRAGVVTAAQEHALRFANEAKVELQSIQSKTVDHTVREQLLALVDYTLERCF